MKKKTIAASLMSIALCGSLVTGATFALFTSESETSIAINAGKVNVQAFLSVEELYSPKSLNLDGTVADATDVAETAFANGGTVTVNGEDVTITNMTPGDKVILKVAIENSSTVAFLQRLTLASIDADKSFFNELLVGLSDTVDGTYTYYSDFATAWEAGTPIAVGADAAVSYKYISIEMPGCVGNDWQGKTSKLALNLKAVQGNAAVSDEAVAKKVLVVSDKASLEEAIASAEDGDTVYLTAPIDSADIVYPTDKTVTVRGYKISTLTIGAPVATFALEETTSVGALHIYNDVDTINTSSVAQDSLYVYGEVGKIVVDGVKGVMTEDGVCALAETQDELTTTLANATTAPTKVALGEGTYTLSTSLANKDIVFVGTKDTVIDTTKSTASTNDANVTFDGVTVEFANENYKGFTHSNKVVYENCTIVGKQFLYASEVEFINCTFENKNDYCVWTYGARDVSFKGCTFQTGGKAILVYNEIKSGYVANITVEDCIFNDDDTLDTVKAAVETGIVSGSDSVYNITMTNCTVNGFAVNDEGINTGNTFYGNKNSMDADHLIVTVKDCKAYSVEKAPSQDDMDKVITNSTAPVKVELGEGNYTLPTVSLANKDVVFAGTKDTVIDTTANLPNTTGANITFDGVTVEFANANYKGFTHSNKVVYENCTIVGKQFLYASEVEFINCTFVNEDDYCVWTYGASDVLFKGCTFQTGGKAILVYNEIKSGYVANITVEDCIFNDNDKLNTVKAAVETGIVSGSDSVYNITMTNCTVNGFAENDEGIATGNTFYGNKNSMDKDHLNVVIDGVDVY